MMPEQGMIITAARGLVLVLVPLQDEHFLIVLDHRHLPMQGVKRGGDVAITPVLDVRSELVHAQDHAHIHQRHVEG